VALNAILQLSCSMQLFSTARVHTAACVAGVGVGEGLPPMTSTTHSGVVPFGKMTLHSQKSGYWMRRRHPWAKA
jgi:hypothetical protein